ncbi:hypothetical protein H4Q26_016392 [Puccinia striiformis f. sp. tritici PST-130]|nr:hypothetical protein H4Q26_016392 [Puccinia striiformis f. sp. tritici PST-130]
MKDFVELLDQTHVVTTVGEPIKHSHKGRPHDSKKKKTKDESLKSTKRDPSAWEYWAKPERRSVAGLQSQKQRKTLVPEMLETVEAGKKQKRAQNVAKKGKKPKQDVTPNSSEDDSGGSELPDNPVEIVTPPGPDTNYLDWILVNNQVFKKAKLKYVVVILQSPSIINNSSGLYIFPTIIA